MAASGTGTLPARRSDRGRPGSVTAIMSVASARNLLATAIHPRKGMVRHLEMWRRPVTHPRMRRLKVRHKTRDRRTRRP